MVLLLFVGYGKTAEAAASTKLTGGNPWLASDVVGNVKEGMEISPVDDFYLYTNYDWLLSAQLPEGHAMNYRLMEPVSQTIKEKTYAVLRDETMQSHDSQLIRTVFNQYIDLDARNAEGLSPIKPIIEKLESIKSIDDVNDIFCDENIDYYIDPLISFVNEAKYDDSSKYETFVSEKAFLLADPAEYYNRTETGDTYYDAKKELVADILSRLGYTRKEAYKKFDNAISFETKLADSAYTYEDTYSADIFLKEQNYYSIDDFYNMFTNYPIEAFTKAQGYDNANEICVMNPEYCKKFDDLYTDDNVEEIKDSMIATYIWNTCKYLDVEAYESYSTAFEKMYGTEGQIPYEEKAYYYISGVLIEPLDRAYLEKYDYSKTKKEITQLCNSIVDTYRQMLLKEDWLSEETRNKAIEKLDNITINAVYPEKWECDYLDLVLSEKSFFETTKLIGKYNERINRSHTNGLVDKDVWNLNILDTNAFYNLSTNSLYIVLGLVDEPYYYDGMSISELYGTIGVHISHEISHAFDSNGSQFDKNGNNLDWWSEEDHIAFDERAQKVVDYMDEITVWKGQNVIGSSVDSEETADMAGIHCLLTMANEIEGFDYNTFFSSYAKTFCYITTLQNETSLVTQDAHPISCVRVNVAVQQFDEFYETYGVKEDDKMYLSPEDRICIW